MARNSLLCADVPLRNYSLTHVGLINLYDKLTINVTDYKPSLFHQLFLFLVLRVRNK